MRFVLGLAVFLLDSPGRQEVTGVLENALLPQRTPSDELDDLHVATIRIEEAGEPT